MKGDDLPMAFPETVNRCIARSRAVSTGSSSFLGVGAVSGLLASDNIIWGIMRLVSASR